MNINKDRIIYFDTEFTGLHRNTSLISLGAVTSKGETFYAEFTDYDESQVDDWLQNNVISNLYLTNEKEISKDGDAIIKGTTDEIRTFFYAWVHEVFNKKYSEQPEPITFYSDCLAYDWVLFTDFLFTNALDVPMDYNYIPLDLCTMFYAINEDPDVSREEFAGVTDISTMKHNALYDAAVIKMCAEKCEDIINNKLEVTTLKFSGLVELGDDGRVGRTSNNKDGAVWIGNKDVVLTTIEAFEPNQNLTVGLADSRFSGPLSIEFGHGYSEYSVMQVDKLFTGEHNLIEILERYEGQEITLWISNGSINLLEDVSPE